MLHILQQDASISLAGLLTTVTEPYDRVSMHGVRRDILAAQAQAAGLPLIEVPIPSPCPNDVYEARMLAAMNDVRAKGIDTVAFGDLFLEDVRDYRVRNLAKVEMAALFPLWQRPTPALATEMVAGGLEAVVVCVDPRQLDPSFCGRRFDAAFITDLPEGVDPCGENGEFHTLVCGGPMFQAPVGVSVGETVERDGFVFTNVALDS